MGRRWRRRRKRWVRVVCKVFAEASNLSARGGIGACVLLGDSIRQELACAAVRVVAPGAIGLVAGERIRLFMRGLWRLMGTTIASLARATPDISGRHAQILMSRPVFVGDSSISITCFTSAWPVLMIAVAVAVRYEWRVVPKQRVAVNSIIAFVTVPRGQTVQHLAKILGTAPIWPTRVRISHIGRYVLIC